MRIRIVIDTREKKPLLFPGYATCYQSLRAGDYSVYGYTKMIAVERKGIKDYLNWLGSQRVISQLKKLRLCPYRCIIVEGDIDSHNHWGLMDKWTVISKTASLMAARVPVLFARNPEMAAYATVRYLSECKLLVDSR